MHVWFVSSSAQQHTIALVAVMSALLILLDFAAASDVASASVLSAASDDADNAGIVWYRIHNAGLAGTVDREKPRQRQ